MTPHRRRFLPTLLVALAATAGDGAVAQFTKLEKLDWRRDPHTDDSSNDHKKLGYVSFGPFSWDSTYGTDHITRTIGARRILWVETAHFKLGCDLAPRLVPGETRVRKRITAELTRLKERLPKIDPRNRKLGRWTLLHLYAQRLEELYRSFCDQLGVTDSDFPSLDGKRTPGHYMGNGPFLGQRGKFCVLLVDDLAQLERYLRAFPKIASKPIQPSRHDLPGAGSMAFVTASACFDGRLHDDLHMHSHVVHELTKNLIEGYKARLGELPTWWLEGLAHWYSRRVDPRIQLLAAQDPREVAHDAWEWDRKVRARVRFDYFPKASELMAERNSKSWGLQLHMMSWSRVDFLIHEDPLGVRRFLDHLKDHPLPIHRLDRAKVEAWQTAALGKAWDLALAGFDEKWREHVMANYPK